MADLHPSGAGNNAFSTSSSTSSNPQFTPVSYGSDEDNPVPGPAKSPTGPLRLQTNFDDHQDVGDPLSDFENNGNYNTSEELEGKLPRSGAGPRYTSEEESEVVRRFDRRLVPFLALLYLLSFLDRSTTSFGGLVVLRALLGITEAAFGPGVPFYLSLFYRRHELAFRNGLFISAAPLATSFASSLAYLIVRFSSDGPISPWRTLFLVEGFPSVIVAVFAWFLIPDSPGRARFLSRRQRVVAQQRLEESTSDYQQSYGSRFNWREILKTASDPKAYMAAFMFFSCNVAFSSMPVFLPTIIKDMGYSSLQAQALSAPPYLVAFVVVLVTAYASDRSRSRSPYLIAHALISSLAYLAIAATGYFHSHLPPWLHIFIRYICVYPATAGFFSAITLIITWSMDNRVEKEGKGASIAILNIIGQCGPLLGTRLYPETDGPWYIRGMATCSFFMVVVAVLAVGLRILLQRMNRAAAETTYTIAQAGPVDQGEERDVLMGGGRRDDLENSTGARRLVYII
ncbi:hypothetical protein PCG10_006232 [Penicillium crustosum]|uniref:Uncharacterized protein n=1 Tax=Penicillium crustosum TaxID=36656 RepID=A0A9P5GM14_PENCR|nr:hypothetical protein PCG10_006232 [Penicillium crustosum]